MARLLCALWLLLAAVAPATAQAPGDRPVDSVAVELRFADGRAPRAVTMQRLNPPAQELYLAGSDLAELLQAGRYWREDVRKLVLVVGEQRITFTSGARSVVSGDDTILLRQEVIYHQGEPWIPLEFLTTILPQISDTRARFVPAEYRLELGERDTNVERLEVVPEPLATELRIVLAEPLAFRVDDSQPRRLVLKLYGAEIDPSVISLDVPTGLVEEVSSTQGDGFALVEVRLSELASRYQSLAEDDGRRVVLRVEQAPLATIPDPVPRGPHLVPTLPPERAERVVDVRRVVIDPGHGGSDHGKEGVGGLLEKDITLAIAKELERILEQRDDIEVVLTREGDVDLGLLERTELANRAGGDLFLSIHCNGWYNGSANGVETYFLSPAKTEWDAQVAREENREVGAAEDLDFILWDLVQNQYIQESASLAEAVQLRLAQDLDLRNRGVKQAGFRVLVGAFMPAILVEVGFLSSPRDGGKLADPDFRQAAAEALADAVVDFRARMDALREGSR